MIAVGFTHYLILFALCIIFAAFALLIQGIRKKSCLLLTGALACVLTLVVGYFGLIMFISSM